MIQVADFEARILRGSGPAVVYIWAPWCPQCPKVKGIVERLEMDPRFSGVSFYSCDIEKAPAVALSYQIQSVPTVIAFKDGEPMGEVRGIKPRGKFVELLEGVLQQWA